MSALAMRNVSTAPLTAERSPSSLAAESWLTNPGRSVPSRSSAARRFRSLDFPVPRWPVMSSTSGAAARLMMRRASAVVSLSPNR